MVLSGGQAMEKPEYPYRITKIAVVVNDLDTPMSACMHASGWGPPQFSKHAAPTLQDQELRGRPADFSMIGAKYEVQSGLVYELRCFLSPSGAASAGQG
jgi:hypothetical protein